MRFQRALAGADGIDGAHCIHELWMRGEFPQNIELALEQLWKSAAKTVPEWLPMRYVELAPDAYEVASRFEAGDEGNRTCISCCSTTQTAGAMRTACTSG